jgi:hypothetical protein
MGGAVHCNKHANKLTDEHANKLTNEHTHERTRYAARRDIKAGEELFTT